jgi:segregation and condensation protein B
MQEQNTSNNIINKIEALLFENAREYTPKKLAATLGVSVTETEDALQVLNERLSTTSMTILRTELGKLAMVTRPEYSDLLRSLRKEELKSDLSKAALETLSIVLYLGRPSKSEIEYIRGVNASFILRNLLMRGLIEKVQHEKDSRQIAYAATKELLAFMGVSRKEELPQYQETVEKLQAFLSSESH